MEEDDLPSIHAAIEAGDEGAAERLLPLVYAELKELARMHMRRESPGHTLQPTALVHEAYLRMLGPDGQHAGDWKGKAHFLAAAAQSMRRILIDRARARGAAKRGGGQRRVDILDMEHLSVADAPPELLDLDAALTRLAAEAPVQAELVSLRFFGGLSNKEAAAVMDLPTTTAHRHWTFARAWLRGAMDGEL